MAKESARERRQDRVANVVWGLILISLGVVFLLDNYGLADVIDPWRYPAPRAVDGNLRTRWSSAWSDPQWIEIDLGRSEEITRVTLHWEAAFAKAYRIEVSDDRTSWTTLREVTEGDGEVDDHPLTARGRHLRVYGTERATQFGYSLWEVEVFGREPANLLSRGKPATASSRETAQPRWTLFWPIVLVGLGLPAVLAPKNDGDQVFGLLLAAVGVFLQLHRLALVDWKLSQVWPLVLLAAGLLLVVQAVREAGRRSSSAGEVGR